MTKIFDPIVLMLHPEYDEILYYFVAAIERNLVDVPAYETKTFEWYAKCSFSGFWREIPNAYDDGEWLGKGFTTRRGVVLVNDRTLPRLEKIFKDAQAKVFSRAKVLYMKPLRTFPKQLKLKFDA